MSEWDGLTEDEQYAIVALDDLGYPMSSETKNTLDDYFRTVNLSRHDAVETGLRTGFFNTIADQWNSKNKFSYNPSKINKVSTKKKQQSSKQLTPKQKYNAYQERNTQRSQRKKQEKKAAAKQNYNFEKAWQKNNSQRAERRRVEKAQAKKQQKQQKKKQSKITKAKKTAKKIFKKIFK